MDRIVIESDKLDEWLRTSFVDGNGEVFLPCGAFGDELTATLCIAHDGVAFVHDGDHVYAPASWLAEHHRGFADKIHAIAANITRRLPTAVEV